MQDKFTLFDQLNRQIIAAQKVANERNRIGAALTALQAEIIEQEALVKMHGHLRDAEEADVIALESISFKSTLLRLLGQYDHHLAREVEEWLAAKLKLAESRLKLGVLLERQASLSIQQSALIDDDNLTKLELQRQAMIADADQRSGNRLLAQSSSLALLESRQTLLAEALTVGSVAQLAVKQIIDLLDQGKDRDGKWAISKPPKKQALFQRRNEMPVRDAVELTDSAEIQLQKFVHLLIELPDQFQPIMPLGTPEVSNTAFSISPMLATGGSTQSAVPVPYQDKYQARLDVWYRHMQLLQRYVAENVKHLHMLLAENQQRIADLQQTIAQLEIELFSAENFT